MVYVQTKPWQRVGMSEAGAEGKLTTWCTASHPQEGPACCGQLGHARSGGGKRGALWQGQLGGLPHTVQPCAWPQLCPLLHAACISMAMAFQHCL